VEWPQNERIGCGVWFLKKKEKNKKKTRREMRVKKRSKRGEENSHGVSSGKVTGDSEIK
jgi:hypothetical protein